MASPRELRRRIRSISGTAQITKAMQMVAASKMRKAQDAAIASAPVRPPALPHPADGDDADGRFPAPAARAARRCGAARSILVAGDKGLCGALNTNVFRVAAQYPVESTVFITAGRKAAQFVSRSGRTLVAEFAYRRLADLRRGAGDCRLRSRPLPRRRRSTRWCW